MQKTLDEIKAKAAPILKEAGVIHSSLFGSYAHGDENIDSDVDILVDVPLGTSLFDMVNLQAKLEKALGKKTDLVTYKSLNPLLKNRILSEQIQIL